MEVVVEEEDEDEEDEDEEEEEVLFFFIFITFLPRVRFLFLQDTLPSVQEWCFIFFTSNIHRRRQIDPRLAFHMESLTFCTEVDSRRLLRRMPWQRLLLW